MSTQGPELEKGATASLIVEAPTVIASSAPAGELLQASLWSLPEVDVEAFLAAYSSREAKGHTCSDSKVQTGLNSFVDGFV